MRKIVFLLAIGLLAAGCSSTSSLYYWGGQSGNATRYEEMAYGMYKKQSPEALCQMLCVFEDIVQNPEGTRNVPPPGICAEYAYFLSIPETAETFASVATKSQRRVFKQSDYASFFPEYARQLFEREITLYPESAIFVKPLIEKLLQQ